MSVVTIAMNIWIGNQSTVQGRPQGQSFRVLVSKQNCFKRTRCKFDGKLNGRLCGVAHSLT